MGRISKKELDTWKAAGRLCFVRENRVYDVSEFASRHPGGEKPLKNNAGRDVTTLMDRENPHKHSSNAYKLMEQYYIGEFEVIQRQMFKRRLFQSLSVSLCVCDCMSHVVSDCAVVDKFIHN